MLLVIAVVLQIADTITTALGVYGQGRPEMNPIMAYLMQNFGPAGLVVPKMAVVILMSYTWWRFGHERAMQLIFMFLIFLYTFVVVSNTFQLLS